MAPARDNTPFVHVAVLGLGLAAAVPVYATHPPEPPGHDEAAERESHQPRHGGTFGDADDIFHYELVRQPGNELLCYVSDDDGHPLDARTLQGRWTLNPDEATAVTGTFAAAADGAYLIGHLPASAQGHPLHLKIEVQQGADWIGMEFYLTGQGGH